MDDRRAAYEGGCAGVGVANCDEGSAQLSAVEAAAARRDDGEKRIGLAGSVEESRP